jgi:hypothetical protein
LQATTTKLEIVVVRRVFRAGSGFRIDDTGYLAIPMNPNTFLLDCFILDQTTTARQQNIFIGFFPFGTGGDRRGNAPAEYVHSRQER